MGSKKNRGRRNTAEIGDGEEADNASSFGKPGHGNGVITDSRFASVHSDPRFREASKHKAKVAIDSRFDRMFTDKSFGSSTRIDKRGRVKKDLPRNPLKHYYRLEEGDEGEREEGKIKRREKAEIEESDSEVEELKNSGGELAETVSDEESGRSQSDDSEEEEAGSEKSDESTTTDSDEEDEAYSEGEDTFFPGENVPEIDKETHRLAVVNMDWNQVKAEDLYVLLSSFLPKGGQIISVSVYPSEFGLKRMEEEAVHGPVGLFDDDKDKSGSEEDYNDDDDEIDNEKLRAYELNRLRYYYAVVECDSIATADYLYKTCDGVEFERSSNKMDLRFIPDSMELKHPPRDVATEAPSKYQGLDYFTKSLQQSKVRLSWDEDEPQRAKSLKRKFNAEQLADLELKEFLASDESQSEEDVDNNHAGECKFSKKHKKDMYRALIQSRDGSDGDDAQEQEDMEVTFNTGLEDISKRILEKKDKKEETVWEAYLRKRKERKKARKYRSKGSSDDDTGDSDCEPEEEPDDFFIEEPSARGNKDTHSKSSKRSKKNAGSVDEAEASRAELELLLADDQGADTNLKGYNLKRKKGQGMKGKTITDEGKIPTVDYEDPRFSLLFTSPHFALDPTDPQFKRSAAYARQMAQKQGNRSEANVGQKVHIDSRKARDLSDDAEADHEKEKLLQKTHTGTRIPTDLSENAEADHDKEMQPQKKYDLSSLVRSVKLKSKLLSQPSSVKVSRKKKL